MTQLTVLSRYLTHAVVLVIVLTVSGYASVSRQLPARFGIQTDANALVMNQGGQVSDFSLGRFSTIVKPLSIPVSAPASHIPFVYTVAASDDLKAIAAKFNVTIEEIRWSNPILADTDKVTGGVKLSIPPIHGVVVMTHTGDTVPSLATSFHAQVDEIINFNRIRIDPLALPAGLQLVIPGGIGPLLTIKAATLPLRAVGGAYRVSLGAPVGSFVNPRFPWGWCTWYVATRRNVTWIGDAYQWYGNAAAQGYPVGPAPQVGAIMVTWESGLGHVAYVEAVYTDGSWLVSEMNFKGFGITSQRTIRPGQVPLIGFIYNK